MVGNFWRKARRGVFILFPIAVSLLRIFASPLDHWSWRNPYPQGTSIRGVAWSKGTFVAVGAAGTLMTSSNAVNWRLHELATSNYLVSVTSDGNIWLAVGEHGMIVLSSDGGQTWSKSAVGVDTTLWDVTQGNGSFVVVSLQGVILVSSNAVDWTVSYSGGTVGAVTYGAGQFVAAGAAQVLTSPDGYSWSEVARPGGFIVSGLAYGKGLYIGAGPNGRIWTSFNAVDWTQTTVGNRSLLKVRFCGDGFVAAGDAALFSSTDGKVWTAPADPIYSYLYDLASSGTQYLAVGEYGELWTSPDALIWTNQLRSVAPTGWKQITGIAYGNRTFVAVGDGSLLSSSDGISWSNYATGTTPVLSAVAYSDGLFVAVSWTDGELVLTSSDGVSWATHNSETFIPLNAVTHGNGLWLAAGAGVTATSPNGENWSYHDIDPRTELFAVCYGKAEFVGVGRTHIGTIFVATVATSLDGMNWTTRLLPEAGQPVGASLTFGNNIFVAAWDGIWTSPDGNSWNEVLPPGAGMGAVAYGNGMFIAMNWLGKIYRSSDGTNWIPCISPTTRWLTAGTYGNGTFVLVGNNGTILQSEFVALPANTLNMLSVQSKEVDLVLRGVVGREYYIQYADELKTGLTWSNLTNLQATSAVQLIRDWRPASVTHRFYRAAMTSP